MLVKGDFKMNNWPIVLILMVYFLCGVSDGHDGKSVCGCELACRWSSYLLFPEFAIKTEDVGYTAAHIIGCIVVLSVIGYAIIVGRKVTIFQRLLRRKDFKNEREDVCVLVHSNKICVVCLAETHPICADKKVVVSVDYQFDSVNRLCNRVSGKRKKGGQNLASDAILCKISCEDGSQYFVPCGLKGKLLETNDSLKNTPAILTEKPLSDGYIAIVLPKLNEYQAEISKLETKETFFKDNKT